LRIISKHRDYYDSVVAHGIDKSVVYLRERKDWPASASKETEKFFSNAPGHSEWNSQEASALTVEAGLILFCGAQLK